MTFWLKALGLIAVAIYLLVGLLNFLGAVKATGMLVVAAVFFAYLVYPLVRRLNERLPLIWAIVFVYAAIAIVAAALAQLVIPALVSDIQNLVKNLPGLVGRLSTELQNPNNRFIRWLPIDERLYLSSLPTQLGTFLQTNAQDFASKTLTVVLSTFSVVRDRADRADPGGLHAARPRAPPASRSWAWCRPSTAPRAESILDDLDKVVGGFIRGQLIDGAIVGAMIIVMLSVMHVPYALLIGICAGLLNFIPYAGAVIGFVPSVLLALASNGPTNALIVAALFAVIQQVDGNFVAPRVLKDNVGLSPFWIIVSILSFSELFGLVGTFLAVPAAAMIRVLREQLVPPPVPRAVAGPELTQEPLAQSVASGARPRD